MARRPGKPATQELSTGISFSYMESLAASVLEVLSDLWKKAIETVSRPNCQIGMSWILRELYGPQQEIPMLFIQLPSVDTFTTSHVFNACENLLREREPDVAIYRLQDSSHPMKVTVTSVVECFQRQNTQMTNSPSLLHPLAPYDFFLTLAKKGLKGAIFMVDTVDHFDPHILSALVLFASQLRDSAFPQYHTRVPTAFVVGSALHSMSFLKSSWPSNCTKLTLSASMTTKTFGDILQEASLLISSDRRLISTLPIPEDFLEIIFDEGKQYHHSVSYVKSRIDLNCITSYCLARLPHLFPSIVIGSFPNTQRPLSAERTELLLRFNKLSDGPNDVGVFRALHQAYTHIISITDKRKSKSKDELAVDMCHFFFGRYFNAVALALDTILHKPDCSAFLSCTDQQNPSPILRLRALIEYYSIDSLLRSLITHEASLTPTFVLHLSALQSTDQQLSLLCDPSTPDKASHLGSQLSEIAQKLRSVSSALLKHCQKTISAVTFDTLQSNKLKLLVMSVSNPCPMDAILYHAFNASPKHRSRSLQPHSLEGCLLAFIRLLYEQQSEPRTDLRSLFVLFLTIQQNQNDQAVSEACLCLNCILQRFFYVYHACIALGLVTEPKMTDIPSDKPSKCLMMAIPGLTPKAYNSFVLALSQQSKVISQIAKAQCRILIPEL